MTGTMDKKGHCHLHGKFAPKTECGATGKTDKVASMSSSNKEMKEIYAAPKAKHKK
jgi:hypothetical protein